MTPAQPPPSRFAWDWVLAWTLVFLANLPVPLLVSWGVVREGGAVGLFGGVAMLHLLGATACGLRWRVGRSLVWGGAVVALTQLVPVLHILSGMLAVGVWDRIVGASSFGGGIEFPGAEGWELVKGNFGVCVVVFLTAQPFMVLALLLGTYYRWRKGDTPLWMNRRTDPDEDPTPEGQDD